MAETDYLALKITTLFTLLVVSVFCVLLPSLLSLISSCLRKRKFSTISHKIIKFMEIIQGFAGGVLLANALLHMLPEAHELIGEGIKSSLPVEAAAANTTESVAQNTTQILMRFAYRRFARGGGHADEAKGPWFQLFPWAGLVCGSVVFVMFCLETLMTKVICHKQSYFKKSKVLTPIVSEFILWASLCVHSVFFGIAFGIEKDEKIWGLWVALYIHHVFEAFSFGVVLQKRSVNNNAVACSIIMLLVFALTYSLSVPIGISIGLGLGSVEGPAVGLIQGFTMSVAAGTFLYMSLFEIMMNHSHFDEEELKAPQKANASSLELVENSITEEKEEQRQVQVFHAHNAPLSTVEIIVLMVRLGLFASGFLAMSALAVFG